MDIEQCIRDYAAGTRLLRDAVIGLSQTQLDARPIPGKWTIREVVCHLADFEPIYGDRMKRVLVEHEPTLFGGDPNLFATGLAYGERRVAEELALIDFTRRQMACILRTLTVEDFQRKGVHSEDGPLTLLTLLQRITGHIPHHLRFIEEKKAAMP